MFLFPFQTSLAIFAVYVLMSPTNILTAEVAFVALSIINILNFPIALVPLAVSYIGQVSQASLDTFVKRESINTVSLLRMHWFLNMHDMIWNIFLLQTADEM